MMKKILTVGFASMALILLAGCQTDNAGTNVNNNQPLRFTYVEIQRDDLGGNYNIVTDSVTGCQYLLRNAVGNSGNGLAPLLDKNGKPCGCKNIKQGVIK